EGEGGTVQRDQEAGGTTASLCRPWRSRPNAATRRWQLRRGASTNCPGGHRRRRTGEPAARRRRKIVRQVLERPDAGDRFQIRRAQARELTPCIRTPSSAGAELSKQIELTAHGNHQAEMCWSSMSADLQ